MSIKYIIFDFAEVFAKGLIGIEKSIFEITGIPEKLIEKHLRHEELYLFFRGKLTEEQYWKKVINRGLSGISVDELKKIIRYNFDEIPGTKSLLETLKKAGYTIGLLSDMPKEWAEQLVVKYNTLFSLFDIIQWSYEIGASKEDENAFEKFLRKSGFIPEETLFLDDREINLKMAKKQGIKYTIQFKDAKSAKKEMLLLGIKL